MALGTGTDQSLDLDLWIWGAEPISLPSPTSFWRETAATLGSHGNSWWYPAILVAGVINIKNQITSPCLIKLISQECISLLFLHLSLLLI